MRARSRLGRATSGVSRVHRTFSVHVAKREGCEAREDYVDDARRAADENRRARRRRQRRCVSRCFLSLRTLGFRRRFGFRRTASRVRSIARSRRAHGRHRTVEAPSLARRHRIPARRSAHLRTFPSRIADPLRQFRTNRILRTARHQSLRRVLGEKVILTRSIERVARRPAHGNALRRPHPRVAHPALHPRPRVSTRLAKSIQLHVHHSRAHRVRLFFPATRRPPVRVAKRHPFPFARFRPRSRERGVVFLIHARPDVFARASADDDARRDDDRRHHRHHHRAPDRSRAGPRARPPLPHPRLRRPRTRDDDERRLVRRPLRRARVLLTTDGRDVRALDNAHRVRRSRARSRASTTNRLARARRRRPKTRELPPRARAARGDEDAREASATTENAPALERYARDDDDGDGGDDDARADRLARGRRGRRVSIVSRARGRSKARGVDEEDEARRRRARGGDER